MDRLNIYTMIGLIPNWRSEVTNPMMAVVLAAEEELLVVEIQP